MGGIWIGVGIGIGIGVGIGICIGCSCSYTLMHRPPQARHRVPSPQAIGRLGTLLGMQSSPQSIMVDDWGWDWDWDWGWGWD
jgi:hypothetical protein